MKTHVALMGVLSSLIFPQVGFGTESSDDSDALYLNYHLPTSPINSPTVLDHISGINNAMTDFLNYGNNQFLALNGLSSTFNCEECIAIKALPVNPIWLSWTTTNEYIQKNNPNSRDKYIDPNEVCKIPLQNGEQSSKYRFLADTKVPDSNPATPNTLRDSAGNLIHYEVVMNDVIEDYLDALLSKGPITEQTKFNFPTETLIKEGSLVLKLAWKELQSDDGERYFRQPAYIFDGNTCRHANVALIAMHIAYRSEYLPQWSWTTFSHIDNSPSIGYNKNTNKTEVPMRSLLLKKWNLYDRHSPSEVKVNTFDEAYSGYNARIANVNEFEFADFTNILRTNPDVAYKKLVREIETNFPNSPWKFYRQDATQWAQNIMETDYANYSNLDQLCNVENKIRFDNDKGEYVVVPNKKVCVVPKHLSNTAIEPYNQKSSCINCHTPTHLKTQKSSNFTSKDFLFFPNSLIKKVSQ
ncbi:hypothetical protein [Pseudoalteromonas luteoviolacea]|uniref:Uncharacterized protein n=1 Tax=Pseudoalteromonas luteoviolacea S4054 TaxID=1129367 RepID=A0A0F6AF76_9GAMM|nr:hypothetical protein [Pseudoalteromonas luteoviolacea]AOT07995.1 hypothetical protein S4054249_09120 [Pseudoalteromonas luteoviolacea]AOT12911.1 hypothetical protein S40542_09120 [Pseudoalteromonas luteoviolacea]AOT17824.1 hypothetical protein S4054_09115 [Pseudoalteromonas luteoviolacea]KKE84456.1 hypothetical protein N479_09450 [Pseudoalteromonas luteoviolacea S4054]KZN71831.1 hypothetical protein N481_17990 [Pseudoalteromonas luteoviolacea S4047-1]